MPPGSRLPAFGSDEWMLEQQLRAEVEAEGWRALRAHLAYPQAAAPLETPQSPAPKPAGPREWRFGAAMLKGIVRFGIGAFGGYLAFIAAMDSGAGEFEAWLAVLAGFVIALSLTAFGPGRRLVAMLASVTAWGAMIALGVGAVYLMSRLAA